MTTNQLLTGLTNQPVAHTHPLGAGLLAAILCLSFLGILGGAIAVTTLLDRHRQADTERLRSQGRDAYTPRP